MKLNNFQISTPRMPTKDEISASLEEARARVELLETELAAARTVAAGTPATLSDLLIALRLHSSSQSPREPPLSAADAPIPFSGDPSTLAAFVFQTRFALLSRPITYAAPILQVQFVVSRLAGSTLDWARGLLERVPELGGDFERFMEELGETFRDPTTADRAAEELGRLSQAGRPFRTYLTEFRVKSVLAGDNFTDAGLLAQLVKGLDDGLRTQFRAAADTPRTFAAGVGVLQRLAFAWEARRGGTGGGGGGEGKGAGRGQGFP